MMSEDNQCASQNGDKAARVLLIDLENCPQQIHQLKENLAHFSQVIICYAQTGAKIPLDWLIPLSAMVSSNKLKIFKMASVGKNAADFGICFFAGALMQQLPEETHFAIVSNDTDLDHVVSLLKSQGRSAERMGIRKEEKETHKLKTETIDAILNSSVKTYCAHLITYNKNRPAKKGTLINSIKNKLKESPDSVAGVLQFLTAKGVVKIEENKVTYNDKKIKELASQP